MAKNYFNRYGHISWEEIKADIARMFKDYGL